MPERHSSAISSQNIKPPHPLDELRDRLNELLTEVGALAIRLKQDARRIQTARDLPAGGHNVLRMLHRFGALTVPQMARLDSTSRQNIQTLVNRLVREGCVESAPNPAHKRSELIRLTDRGLASLEIFTRNSDAYKEKLVPHLAKDDLASATRLLRIIRESLSATAIQQGKSEPRALTPLSASMTRKEEVAPPSKVETSMREAVRVEKTFSNENELPVSLL